MNVLLLFRIKEQCSFIRNDDSILLNFNFPFRRLSLMPPQPTELALCAVEDVEVGHAIKIEAEGLTLAVFNLEGEFFVTDDLCTHGPGSLSEGCIIGDAVECNFHNGVFDIRTGAVLAPPCVTPLRTYPASVRNNKVFVMLQLGEARH